MKDGDDRKPLQDIEGGWGEESARHITWNKGGHSLSDV